MEKKSNATKKRKKVKFNLRNIIIVLAIIIVIVLVVVLINRNKKNNEGETQGDTAGVEQQDQNAGLIDMTATDNAKVENGVKTNTSSDLAKEKTVEDLTLSDIQLMAENGISNFTATVKNNANTDFAGGVATIVFTNQDGSTYAEFDVYIPEVKAGETNTINASTTADIINAYDFTIEMQSETAEE